MARSGIRHPTGASPRPKGGSNLAICGVHTLGIRRNQSPQDAWRGSVTRRKVKGEARACTSSRGAATYGWVKA